MADLPNGVAFNPTAQVPDYNQYSNPMVTPQGTSIRPVIDNGMLTYRYFDSKGVMIPVQEITRTPMPIDETLGLGEFETETDKDDEKSTEDKNRQSGAKDPKVTGTTLDKARTGGDRPGVATPWQGFETGQSGTPSRSGFGGLFGNSDFVSAEPGRFGIAGLSTGTGFTGAGVMHDTINFDAGDFIGGIMGTALGVPGGGLIGRQLDANAVLSGTATDVSAQQVMDAPEDTYTKRQKEAAKEYLDRTKDNPLAGAAPSDLAENQDTGTDMKQGQFGNITDATGKRMSPMSETPRETPYGPTRQFGMNVGIPGRRPAPGVAAMPNVDTTTSMISQATNAAMAGLQTARTGTGGGMATGKPTDTRGSADKGSPNSGGRKAGESAYTRDQLDRADSSGRDSSDRGSEPDDHGNPGGAGSGKQGGIY